MVLVSIIIVNWNAKKYLKKCIESLLSQTFTDNEIILVDNASSDDSVGFVKDNFPQIKIIQNKDNVGFAEGNNIGIKNSTGKIIVLFNPDAVADKKWLSTLIDILQSSETIAAVTGKMYYLDDKYGKDAVFCTWSKINPYSAVPTNFYEHEPSSKVDYLSGAAMVVKRNVLDKIGLMDSNYFLYFEETDLCARMIRAGYDLMYVSNAIAWHAVSPLSISENKIYYMERNRFRFALKNFDISYIPIFVTYYMVESLAIFLRDLKNGSMKRTKIRAKALFWNFSNLHKIWKHRTQDFNLIQNHGIVKSYNRSLPLRDLKNK